MFIHTPIYARSGLTNTFKLMDVNVSMHMNHGQNMVYGLWMVMVIHLILGILMLSCWVFGIPSGKRTKNYGKSQFLMGKLTINGHFQ